MQMNWYNYYGMEPGDGRLGSCSACEGDFYQIILIFQDI